MKMKLILASILSLSFQFGICQILIPKAGVTLSTITSSDNGVSNDARTGFAAGCAFNFGLSKNLTLQPELSFIQKGSNSKQNRSFDYSMGVTYFRVESESKSNASINYIELPVLIKLTLPSHLYIAAGPAIAYGLGGSYKTQFNYTQYENDLVLEKFSTDGDGDVEFGQDHDAYPPYGYHEDLYIDHKVDFGLQVAGGVTFSKIVLDLRYCHGLTNLWGGAQNRSIYLTLGIPLKLK